MKAPISHECAKMLKRYIGIIPKNKNSKHVLMDGVLYQSITDVAEELRVSPFIVTSAIKKGSKLYGHVVRYA